MNKEIILASTSPRRKELLERIGVTFKIVASPYEEDNSLHKKPKDLVKALSFGKVALVAVDNPDAIVIGADTVVTLKNVILGKPKSEKEAKKMLKDFSGNTASIYTGYTVMNGKTKKYITDVIEVKVKFHELSKKEIDWYVKTGEPMDKAGAFAIQGIGMMFIENINGDFSAGIGLPMMAIKQTLEKFGIKTV